MTAAAVITALNLPVAARVDQRVPKKLLLENGAPTAADKRLINEGIEAIHWLAVLKPTTCGVPEFRDAAREYLEIAVLHVILREQAKETRLIELLHRAVPYPAMLLVERGHSVSVSLAHKRQALKETDKVVLDGDPVTVTLHAAGSNIHAAFLQAMDLARQPRSSLYALYQSWQDTALALQVALLTGAFTLLDSAERAQRRREALHASIALQGQISSLRSTAAKASQMARQVELNLQIRKLESELKHAMGKL
ncbi:hypothetical protein CSC70_01540 [Pseudoxanthomonas kalamensis DSM 18571]|uniref:DUF4391 domain-containing protein n=1 Tax=Pseudoxanthomonas kalamensis TaxID=289483 RepID=UPI0013917B66|nr:DUF4391 domain-containing protein [Pseudoxanthomonas kalamensis]KAF1712238.1 hypothetical protein CSC70_01540 [Pseudoxanthomonas kalamensis DSM 18571]